MKSITATQTRQLIALLAAGLMMAAAATSANAGSGNGADGWRKLQDRQANQNTEYLGQHASDDNYAAQIINAHLFN